MRLARPIPPLALALLIAALAPTTPALSLESERSVTVSPGEKVRLWSGGNYGRRCLSAGPPVFALTSRPALGEVTAEVAPFTVPGNERCRGTTQPGLTIWYKAGPATGRDVFAYTLEFPHEPGNPEPSKGPQPVTETVTVR